MKQVKQFLTSEDGMVGNVVGLIVGLIALVAVGIPITKSVVAAANLTGIDATIVSYLTTFMALGALVLVVYTVVQQSK